jgi:predicted site-specific integrase-resolvase
MELAILGMDLDRRVCRWRNTLMIFYAEVGIFLAKKRRKFRKLFEKE